MDYGCGAGTLCEKFYALGYKEVKGFDTSLGMIAMAKSNYGQHVEFIYGTDDTELPIQPVDALVSVMVLQFVEDISRTFQNIAQCIKPGGLFIFAVHNPAYISVHLQRGTGLFSHFDSTERPTVGRLNLGANQIPIFIRPASYYNEFMQPYGFKKVLEEYPPFTEEFLARYTTDVADVPEYLILGYTR